VVESLDQGVVPPQVWTVTVTGEEGRGGEKTGEDGREGDKNAWFDGLNILII
jgi:hypothetical protein